MRSAILEETDFGKLRGEERGYYGVDKARENIMVLRGNKTISSTYS